MAFIDYYKIMGVDKSATQDDIRKAYRHRAKIWHPDLHPDDPKAKAKFQALNEANTVLSDPEKRAKYDKYGEHWEHADQFEQAGGGFGGFGGGGFGGFDFSQFSGGAGGGFSSFFEDLFGGRMGGGGRSRMREPEADMEVKVQIDLYTALLGGEILLQTQNERLRLKVKPETQNGTKVRLRGKGYRRSDGTFGNLIITYEVKLPTGLTERQKSLLREMQQAR